MASVRKARKNVSRNAAARRGAAGARCARALPGRIFSTVLFGHLNEDQISQHDLGWKEMGEFSIAALNGNCCVLIWCWKPEPM